MKKALNNLAFLLMFLIFPVFIISCKDDEPDDEPDGISEIEGVWECTYRGETMTLDIKGNSFNYLLVKNGSSFSGGGNINDNSNANPPYYTLNFNYALWNQSEYSYIWDGAYRLVDACLVNDDIIFRRRNGSSPNEEEGRDELSNTSWICSNVTGWASDVSSSYKGKVAFVFGANGQVTYTDEDGDKWNGTYTLNTSKKTITFKNLAYFENEWGSECEYSLTNSTLKIISMPNGVFETTFVFSVKK